MITLHFMNRHSELKEGDVIHLRIISNESSRQILVVDDVTPLPGAEPTGYCCNICEIIEAAKEDGSLPEGWEEQKYDQGSFYACPNDVDEPFCRVCGCTRENPCAGGCHWVAEDLCSACV